MHITLSMLASSASDNSDTQKQLLQVLGRTNNLQNLEKYYDTTLTDYEVRKMTQIMSLESYLDFKCHDYHQKNRIMIELISF